MGDFVWQQTAPPPKDNNVKKKDNWKKVEEMEDYLEHQEEVQKDLLRLDVYFQSMTMTFVMEEPKYSVRTMAFCISIVFSYSIVTFQTYELFCNLGGSLSLFLGISLAMLFEFLEILIEICSNYLCKK